MTSEYFQSIKDFKKYPKCFESVWIVSIYPKMLHLCTSLTLNVAQFFAIFVSNAFAQFIFGCRELDSGY